jgi:hypothetical protein
MMELQDIFANALTTSVFIDASAVLLLVSALAAVWFCRPASDKPSAGKAGQFAVGRDR